MLAVAELQPSRINEVTDSPRAWLMAAAAFATGFVVFGIIYSFGVFFGPIAAEFQVGNVAISALFSITSLVFYCVGSMTGPLGDRFGPRLMIGTGAILMGTGLAATAFIDRIWVGYVTYGVGVGVGVGAACAYVASLAIVGGWFVKRRGTALGIAATGTGCGMLIVPPLAAALINAYGWRCTEIILGMGCVALLAACAAVVRPPPLAGATATRSLNQVFRSPTFILLYISWVLATTALFVPFVYLPAYARDHGASQVAASALLSLLGGMSILGRVGISALGDRIGIVRLFKISVFVMGASYLLWLSAPAYGWPAGFVAVLGLAYGVRISLMPGVLIECFGMQNLGAILGIFFTASGIAAAIGPLLAGLIVDSSGDSRWGVVFALATGAAGYLTIIPLKNGRAPGDRIVIAKSIAS